MNVKMNCGFEFEVYPGMFPDRETAHAEMMKDLSPALIEAREAGCFPSEALFQKAVRELWTKVYSRCL